MIVDRGFTIVQPVDPYCRLLEWDSAHFGFPVARLDSGSLTGGLLPLAENWCRQNSVRCLYFLAAASENGFVRIARESGFDFVDVRLTLGKDLVVPAAERSHPTIRVRAAMSSDLPALEHLASQSHRDTRFYKDRRFPVQGADELYRKWIRRDVGSGDAMTASAPDGDPLGYVTLTSEADKGLASIGLIAVSEMARSRGVGRSLVEHALARAASQTCKRVSVVTQASNIPALRLYESMGFRIISCDYWFHRWFD